MPSRRTQNTEVLLFGTEAMQGSQPEEASMGVFCPCSQNTKVLLDSTLSWHIKPQKRPLIILPLATGQGPVPACRQSGSHN